MDQSTDRFPFGVVLSRTASLLDLVMDAERPWLNFGGKCGFYVSDATVRGSVPEGEVARELAERIIWHYFDEKTGPIPKTSSFESVYELLLRCYRGILDACMCVDDLVSLSGDELIPDISELKEWPEVLLYLGLRNSHPPFGVTWHSVPRILKRDFVGSSYLDHPEIPFDAPEEDWKKVFSRYHKVFRICPSSVASATSYALEALRRMVHAVDATAADGEAASEAPRVPSQSITAYDDEVKRAAKEDFHPSVDFLEPLAREIKSIVDSFGIRGPLRSLESLHMLFEDLMPTDFRFPSDGEGNLVAVSTDERSPAWERARHWLLAARLKELCDDFTDRTERQRDAIARLWRAGRQLDADDLGGLQIEEYVDWLQSLSLTLKQHTPVTTNSQTLHGPAAGEGDNRQPPAAVGRATETLTPGIDAGVSPREVAIPIERDDEEANRDQPMPSDIDRELQNALETHGIRPEVAKTLSREKKRNIIMAHWSDTPAKTRDRWQERNWTPSLGKQSKTKLADKVKSYIKRGRETLRELANKEQGAQRKE